MSEPYFEQGPIRPPSEAYSLLLRVTRNCPWNRCEFCHTYQGEKFSLRSVEEVKKDIDAIREVVSEIKSLSWSKGFGGEIAAPLANFILQHPHQFPERYRSVILWLYTGGKNVFLQDANNLIHKAKNLVEILSYLKKTFPSIERITTYARAKTVSQKTAEELGNIHQAGLSRIHIGLETGYDPLLQYVQKGVTAQEHIDAGRKIKESGISLSEYVVLGLGGQGMWREHAIETAKVLNQIDPDFIRVRTLKVLKTMALYQKVERREFILLGDDEVVVEERLLVETLEGITSNFVSDHVLNLLEEVEGKLPDGKRKMLAVIDRYLALPREEKANFRLGRRAGLYRSLEDLSNPELRIQVDEILRRIETENPGNLDKLISDMMESFI
ncbi:MAG TPA: radical SAM protein [Thermodesulfobacteriota bacterium]|nr:radical SAM protein [Thermodesulfobacteriota bacterium]